MYDVETVEDAMHEVLISDGGITIHADGAYEGAGALQEDATLDAEGNLVLPGYEVVNDGFAAGTLPAEPGTYFMVHIESELAPFNGQYDALVRVL